MVRKKSLAKTAAKPTAVWRDMLRAYRRPGVPADCLRLQDRCDLDVTLLLLACHLAATGAGSLPLAECRRLDRSVAPLRRASVLPLRRMRRALKPPTGAAPDPVVDRLRARLLAAEIAAERLVVERLVALAPRPVEPGADPAADALASLRNLARARNVALAGADLAAARRLALSFQRPRRSEAGAGIAVSPQRRTAPVSRPNRSSTRPTL